VSSAPETAAPSRRPASKQRHIHLINAFVAVPLPGEEIVL
jgi:hypothetical protein